MNPIPNLIAKHIFWKGFYYFSVLLVNILVARVFGAAGSGHIFYVVNNLSFILLLLSGSMESGSTYFAANGKMDRIKIARFCLAWALVATLVFTACLVFLRSFSTFSPFASNQVTFACCLFVPGILLTSFFTALFYSRQDFFTPNIILGMVNAVLIVFLIFGRHAPLVSQQFLPLYFSSFLLQGVLILVAYFFINRSDKAKGMLTQPEMALLLKYSGRALLANILFFLVGRVDYWFVERFCSSSDLGNYIQASKLAQLFLLIPSTVAATLFPVIASAGGGTFKQGLRSITKKLLAFTITAAGILAIVGGRLFPFVFGHSFREMHILFILLIPGILALTAHYPLTAYNSGVDRIKVNITGSLIAVIVIIVLDLLLLPVFGVRAASCISSLGYGCYFLYLLFIRRKDNKPVEGL